MAIRHRDRTLDMSESAISALLGKNLSSQYGGGKAADAAILDRYLEGMDLSALSPLSWEELELEITLEVVKEAVGKLNRWMMPGGAGFPVVFYQAYVAQLAEPLLTVFREDQRGGGLPPTLREKKICIIPKPGGDGTSPPSYGPLTMLNVDMKVLCKILAERLKSFVATLVHEDKYRFIPGRSTALNLQRLLLM
ncbi:hypothetical protein NDU88_009452 [Pleurodeles waltl]|uniref:Reverse transcriptase domain-containing protein n=1 Tax=Pleurodeles waltl TaxID=8319 RepID=A0AAV7RXM0_PLEWA|nr:hypothetical protein NDU88_009452 [Pleurodeles waltl]